MDMSLDTPKDNSLVNLISKINNNENISRERDVFLNAYFIVVKNAKEGIDAMLSVCEGVQPREDYQAKVGISLYNSYAGKMGKTMIKSEDMSKFTEAEEKLIRDARPEIEKYYLAILEAQNAKIESYSKAENSGLKFFQKFNNAIVNFFTKTLPSLFIHTEKKYVDMKDAVKVNNASKESTFATAAKALSGGDPKIARESLANIVTNEKAQIYNKGQEQQNGQSNDKNIKVDVKSHDVSQVKFSSDSEPTYKTPGLR